jgi:RHS repeat-associated protein
MGGLQILSEPPGLAEFDYQGLTTTTRIHEINNDVNQIAVTVTQRDFLDRMAAVTPPQMSATAEYVYDELDQLKEVRHKDPSSGATLQTRTWDYDPIGRVLSSDPAEAGETTYDQYDAGGNLRQYTQPDLTVVTQGYDDAGRLTTVSITPDGAPTPILVGRRTYDTAWGVANELPLGKLSREEAFDDAGAPVVTKDLTYAGLNGRLSLETTRFAGWATGGGTVDIVAEYGYDVFARLDSIGYPLEDGSSRPATAITKGFKHGWPGWIDSLEVPIVDEMSWNPAGGRASVVSGNGVETIYDKDPRNRPLQITVAAPTGTVFDTGTYVYDGRSDITSIGSDEFHYDLAGRLDAATMSANGQASDVYDQSFGYDLLGNMTSKTRTFGPPGSPVTITDTFQVDLATNHLISVNGTTVAHNENGDLESDGIHGFVWGRRSRLTSVGDGTATVGSYAYDVSAYRVKKSDATQLRETFFVRDVNGRVLTEFSKPVDSTLEPHWNRDYVYAGDHLAAIIRNADPLEPSWLDSSATGSSVSLSWAPTPDTDLYGYHVYRTQTPGSGYERLNTSTLQSPSFVDPSPLLDQGGSGIPAYYVVTAVDFAGIEGRVSDERLITAGDATAPTAPLMLTAEGFNGRVDLSWATVTAPDMAGYDVFRSTVSTAEGGTFTQLNGVPVTGTSYQDFAVTNGTTYYYKIKAVDTASNSSPFGMEDLAIPSAPGGGGGSCGPNCFPGKGYLDPLLLPPCGPGSTGNDHGFCFPGERIEALASHPGLAPGREILYVHTDHLGSTRVLTNSDGEVVDVMHFFPFGEQMPTANTPATTHLFTGHERDSESTLNYMMARYYGPLLGRFLSVDPVADSDQGSPPSWNRYSYVRNKPLSFNDLDGLRMNPVTYGQGIDPTPAAGERGRIRKYWNPQGGKFGNTRDRGKVRHDGLDINAAKRTDVRAAEAGTVVAFGHKNNKAGTEVVLAHPSGERTYYQHLDGTDVAVGQKVREGQIVGQAGTSGNAGGLADSDQEHLHFAVRDASGRLINPETWLNDPKAAPPALIPEADTASPVIHVDFDDPHKSPEKL